MLGVLLTIVHVIVALFLILVVLLQTGKRADLAGAFGGGGSQTAFGTRGAATVLSKATTAAAVVFMLTSLSLSIVSDRAAQGTGSVLDDADVPAAPPAPAPTTGTTLPEGHPLEDLAAQPGVELTPVAVEDVPFEQLGLERPEPATSPVEETSPADPPPDSP